MAAWFSHGKNSRKPLITKNMKQLFFILGIAAFAISSQAQSTFTWNWSYSSDLFSGSGTLTTQDHITTNTYGIFYSGSGYLITGVTGTFNGSQITGLLGQGSIGNNDDYLLGASQPQLDGWGFSFSTTVTSFNIGYTHICNAENRTLNIFSAKFADDCVLRWWSWRKASRQNEN